MKKKATKLKLNTERLTTVAGGSWHRNSLRCHETWTGCGISADTVCCVTVVCSMYYTACC